MEERGLLVEVHTDRLGAHGPRGYRLLLGRWLSALAAAVFADLEDFGLVSVLLAAFAALALVTLPFGMVVSFGCSHHFPRSQVWYRDLVTDRWVIPQLQPLVEPQFRHL